jgi:hypothetical protein
MFFETGDGMLTVRDYVEQDREACLAVFDSNLPDYFGEQNWDCDLRQHSTLRVRSRDCKIGLGDGALKSAQMRPWTALVDQALDPTKS